MPLTYAKSLIFLGIIILVFKQGVSKLPYEVLDSIVELSEFDDFKDLRKVNVSDERGPTRPVYRLDLGPNYVAYYEIDTGKDYVILSSGPTTRDFREVQSGPDPRPTDFLIQQAQRNDQKCEKFYRLSPLGLTICKNHKGTVVAASYNWTADVAEIDNWRILDQMVKTSQNEFQGMWKKRAAESRTILDWATTDIGKAQKKKVTEEEALSPGSVVKVALGEQFKSLNIYITSFGKRGFHPKSKSRWQQKLCKVLVDVCLKSKFEVNPLAVKKTPNNLFYLKLEIHSSLKYVKKMLEGRELGFDIRIQLYPHQVIIKHYAINLQSKRFGRSPPESGNKKVPGADHDMPDYNQHKCCGNCWSGCGPVAWAQVFGYYDRRASAFRSIFSPQIYGDSSKIAPKTMTNEVRYFVEDIRRQVKTFCEGGQGSTYSSKMRLIQPWFQGRQGAKARVVSYRRKTAFWLRSKGKWWLDTGYPVIFDFKISSKAGHSVVATKYRITTRQYRLCRKCRICVWKTSHDYEFFLHYGWGGFNNQWQMLHPFSAHVAYISK